MINSADNEAICSRGRVERQWRRAPAWKREGKRVFAPCGMGGRTADRQLIGYLSGLPWALILHWAWKGSICQKPLVPLKKNPTTSLKSMGSYVSCKIIPFKYFKNAHRPRGTFCLLPRLPTQPWTRKTSLSDLAALTTQIPQLWQHHDTDKSTFMPLLDPQWWKGSPNPSTDQTPSYWPVFLNVLLGNVRPSKTPLGAPQMHQMWSPSAWHHTTAHMCGCSPVHVLVGTPLDSPRFKSVKGSRADEFLNVCPRPDPRPPNAT